MHIIRQVGVNCNTSLGVNCNSITVQKKLIKRTNRHFQFPTMMKPSVWCAWRISQIVGLMKLGSSANMEGLGS